jgi:hypothetical protein
MPGDIQQIALQANMTGQATGRYNYTATVVDYRSTSTTTTITGTMSVLNDSSSTIGDGWTVQGLEKITSASEKGKDRHAVFAPTGAGRLAGLA